MTNRRNDCRPKRRASRASPVSPASPMPRPSRRNCSITPGGCRHITRCCSRRSRTCRLPWEISSSAGRTTIPRPSPPFGPWLCRSRARGRDGARLAFRSSPRCPHGACPRGSHRARPGLDAGARRHADPDVALDTLDRAFARMPAAVELLTILRSNDRLRLLFADLLGSAPRLAETVAFSPMSSTL